MFITVIGDLGIVVIFSSHGPQFLGRSLINKLKTVFVSNPRLK